MRLPAAISSVTAAFAIKMTSNKPGDLSPSDIVYTNPIMHAFIQTSNVDTIKNDELSSCLIDRVLFGSQEGCPIPRGANKECPFSNMNNKCIVSDNPRRFPKLCSRSPSLLSSDKFYCDELEDECPDVQFGNLIQSFTINEHFNRQVCIPTTVVCGSEDSFEMLLGLYRKFYPSSSASGDFIKSFKIFGCIASGVQYSDDLTQEELSTELDLYTSKLTDEDHKFLHFQMVKDEAWQKVLIIAEPTKQWKAESVHLPFYNTLKVSGKGALESTEHITKLIDFQNLENGAFSASKKGKEHIRGLIHGLNSAAYENEKGITFFDAKRFVRYINGNDFQRQMLEALVELSHSIKKLDNALKDNPDSFIGASSIHADGRIKSSGPVDSLGGLIVGGERDQWYQKNVDSVMDRIISQAYGRLHLFNELKWFDNSNVCELVSMAGSSFSKHDSLSSNFDDLTNWNNYWNDPEAAEEILNSYSDESSHTSSTDHPKHKSSKGRHPSEASYLSNSDLSEPSQQQQPVPASNFLSLFLQKWRDNTFLMSSSSFLETNGGEAEHSSTDDVVVHAFSEALRSEKENSNNFLENSKDTASMFSSFLDMTSSTTLKHDRNSDLITLQEAEKIYEDKNPPVTAFLKKMEDLEFRDLLQQKIISAGIKDGEKTEVIFNDPDDVSIEHTVPFQVRLANNPDELQSIVKETGNTPLESSSQSAARESTEFGHLDLAAVNDPTHTVDCAATPLNCIDATTRGSKDTIASEMFDGEHDGVLEFLNKEKNKKIGSILNNVGVPTPSEQHPVTEEDEELKKIEKTILKNLMKEGEANEAAFFRREEWRRVFEENKKKVPNTSSVPEQTIEEKCKGDVQCLCKGSENKKHCEFCRTDKEKSFNDCMTSMQVMEEENCKGKSEEDANCYCFKNHFNQMESCKTCKRHDVDEEFKSCLAQDLIPCLSKSDCSEEQIESFCNKEFDLAKHDVIDKSGFVSNCKDCFSKGKSVEECAPSFYKENKQISHIPAIDQAEALKDCTKSDTVEACQEQIRDASLIAEDKCKNAVDAVECTKSILESLQAVRKDSCKSAITPEEKSKCLKKTADKKMENITTISSEHLDSCKDSTDVKKCEEEIRAHAISCKEASNLEKCMKEVTNKAIESSTDLETSKYCKDSEDIEECKSSIEKHAKNCKKSKNFEKCMKKVVEKSSGSDQIENHDNAQELQDDEEIHEKDDHEKYNDENDFGADDDNYDDLDLEHEEAEVTGKDDEEVDINHDMTQIVEEKCKSAKDKKKCKAEATKAQKKATTACSSIINPKTLFNCVKSFFSGRREAKKKCKDHPPGSEESKKCQAAVQAEARKKFNEKIKIEELCSKTPNVCKEAKVKCKKSTKKKEDRETCEAKLLKEHIPEDEDTAPLTHTSNSKADITDKIANCKKSKNGTQAADCVKKLLKDKCNGNKKCIEKEAKSYCSIQENKDKCSKDLTNLQKITPGQTVSTFKNGSYSFSVMETNLLNDCKEVLKDFGLAGRDVARWHALLAALPRPDILRRQTYEEIVNVYGISDYLPQWKIKS